MCEQDVDTDGWRSAVRLNGALVQEVGLGDFHSVVVYGKSGSGVFYPGIENEGTDPVAHDFPVGPPPPPKPKALRVRSALVEELRVGDVVAVIAYAQNGAAELFYPVYEKEGTDPLAHDFPVAPPPPPNGPK